MSHPGKFSFCYGQASTPDHLQSLPLSELIRCLGDTTCSHPRQRSVRVRVSNWPGKPKATRLIQTGDVDHVTLVTPEDIVVVVILTNDKAYVAPATPREYNDSPVAGVDYLAKLEPVTCPVWVLTYYTSEGFIRQTVLDGSLYVVTTPG